MMKEYYKHPRLYLKDPLQPGASLSLSREQAHYLKNVLRKAQGDIVRVFNGRDGEWVSQIMELHKKGGCLTVGECLKPQPERNGRLHLYFAPIKKQRMDILIEKAVELGVGEFHPVMTSRTENRKLNKERLEAQIFEAAEQCERLEIPVLHEAAPLLQVLKARREYPLYVGLEREETKSLAQQNLGPEIGFLIGPEGGFDDNEIESIKASNAVTVSLGEAVLRAESAAIVCLTWAMLAKQRA
jgi:16S rRNA (uracil1498-N3)-methyltransferase